MFSIDDPCYYHPSSCDCQGCRDGRAEAAEEAAEYAEWKSRYDKDPVGTTKQGVANIAVAAGATAGLATAVLCPPLLGAGLLAKGIYDYVQAVKELNDRVAKYKETEEGSDLQAKQDLAESLCKELQQKLPKEPWNFKIVAWTLGVACILFALFLLLGFEALSIGSDKFPPDPEGAKVLLALFFRVICLYVVVAAVSYFIPSPFSKKIKLIMAKNKETVKKYNDDMVAYKEFSSNKVKEIRDSLQYLTERYKSIGLNFVGKLTGPTEMLLTKDQHPYWSLSFTFPEPVKQLEDLAKLNVSAQAS